MIGQSIKEFKITGRLGKGGMGEVWIAEQQIVKTRVAIKILSESLQDDAQIQRFFNEAVAADRIRHAGIVKIFDVGFHERRPYLIMELLEGESLVGAIKRHARMPLPEVGDIVKQLASVLGAVHAAGITHRDLKPDNIFLVPDAELGARRRVKVLDFGIAKLAAIGPSITATSSSMGTPAYMAPEQWRDAATADARADIYSLGCLAFELCTGRPPFVASTIGEACTKHLTEDPPRLSSLARVPVAIDALVDRMLAKEPEARPAIAEIAAAFGNLAATPVVAQGALDATLATGETHAPTPLVTTTLGGAAGARGDEDLDTPARHPRRWPYLVAGALLAGAGVAAYVVMSKAPAPTAAPIVAKAPPIDAAPPREPTLGLRTMADVHAPTSSSNTSLRSESNWIATRDDFADACKQPGAPVRWCAAADFADGELAMIHDKHADADVAFRRAIARDPTWAEPYVGLSASFTSRADLEHALEASRQAQRLDSEWWIAIAVGARAYSAAQKFPEAIVEYRTALTRAPKSAVLLAEIAFVYHASAQDAESDRYAAEALALDPNLVTIHLMRAERALEKSDGKTALTEADRAIAGSPRDLGAHLARADALALLARKVDALAEYENVIELHATDQTRAADARYQLAVKAVATKKLPPPRYQAKPTLGRTTTRTRTINGTNPNERSRPGCSANDPLCNTDVGL